MKRVVLVLSVFVLLIAAISFSMDTEPNQERKLKSYLALGDSYTIGESVKENERWPVQLVNVLNEKAEIVAAPKIIAKTGWRTDDLMNAAKGELREDDSFDLVSLLIGVNNEYQGWDVEDFEPEFRQSLEYAIAHCSGGKTGVFVLSIPDYGYTPYGKNKQERISRRIDAYNEVCERVSKEYGVTYFNITPISRGENKNGDLVASDGLHPSGKQYGLWIEHIISGVKELVEQ